MDSETLEKIKRQYSVLAPNRILDLVAEVERLQTENTQLETKFNQLIHFCLSAGLTPEWVEVERPQDEVDLVERLQAENEQLKEALQAYYNFSTDERFAFYPEKTFTERLNDITIKAGEVLKK